MRRAIYQLSNGGKGTVNLSAAVTGNWLADENFVGTVRTENLPQPGQTKDVPILTTKEDTVVLVENAGGNLFQLSKARKPGGTALRAITILDVRDTGDMNVNAAESFPDTPDGRADALRTFKAWAEEAAGDVNEDDAPDLDAAFSDGKYEVGEGGIYVVNSF